ncbi:hypothetical protein B0H17DRAFT_1144085 [Mycena rosella]|uniref:Uncharacterized protein n=1 Tax=Mycena rosella TaxID=1033263 RepID=A0AAD7CTU0_MYCRO|nr:hypothetical protein B0H17DRAFT_1144085 [Mycena rosella]
MSSNEGPGHRIAEGKAKEPDYRTGGNTPTAVTCPDCRGKRNETHRERDRRSSRQQGIFLRAFCVGFQLHLRCRDYFILFFAKCHGPCFGNGALRDRDPPRRGQRNGRSVTVTVASLQGGTAGEVPQVSMGVRRAMRSNVADVECFGNIDARDMCDGRGWTALRNGLAMLTSSIRRLSWGLGGLRTRPRHPCRNGSTNVADLTSAGDRLEGVGGREREEQTGREGKTVLKNGWEILGRSWWEKKGEWYDFLSLWTVWYRRSLKVCTIVR